jgi:hypothetical protein
MGKIRLDHSQKKHTHITGKTRPNKNGDNDAMYGRSSIHTKQTIA